MVQTLREALLVVLDQIDYTADPPACAVTEMVGAVLPVDVIKAARAALAADATLHDVRRGTFW
jgi:hypothetical protein